MAQSLQNRRQAKRQIRKLSRNKMPILFIITFQMMFRFLSLPHWSPKKKSPGLVAGTAHAGIRKPSKSIKTHKRESIITLRGKPTGNQSRFQKRKSIIKRNCVPNTSRYQIILCREIAARETTVILRTDKNNCAGYPTSRKRNYVLLLRRVSVESRAVSANTLTVNLSWEGFWERRKSRRKSAVEVQWGKKWTPIT